MDRWTPLCWLGPLIRFISNCRKLFDWSSDNPSLCSASRTIWSYVDPWLVATRRCWRNFVLDWWFIFDESCVVVLVVDSKLFRDFLTIILSEIFRISSFDSTLNTFWKQKLPVDIRNSINVLLTWELSERLNTKIVNPYLFWSRN